MTKEIHKELNPYFEIIGLLYNCNHPDFMANDFLEKTVAEFGIDIEEFNKKVVVVIKKYISAFAKEMEKGNAADYDFFFSEEDDDFILSLQFVCANHREWFENDFAEITEEEILSAFMKEVVAAEDDVTKALDFDEIMTLLSRGGFSSNTCWKLMLIFQSPREKMEKLSKLMRQNCNAYRKALTAVEKPLNRLLEKFPAGDLFCSSLHENSNLTPILIYPAVELVNTTGSQSNSFIGLFIADVYQMKQKSKEAQNNLLPCLKAISDKSKFDILHSLIQAPKYNLELAEELQLSAATVSHHMNVLLTCRLVNVEKKDGRVYYTLAKETLEKLLLDLRNQFLI